MWAEHVARIAAPLVAAGYEVQLWADVLRTDPEAARALPDGTVPVSWNYEAPGGADLPGEVTALLARLGLEPSAFRGFAANVAPLAAAGLRFRVAPGTSSWNSLVGRIDNATANIRDAVDVALAHGVDGICVTDWGDNGHIQPPPVSWPALAYGGAVAWCREANWDLDLARVLDTHVFAD
ncbi:MAG: glycoside hydrolase, partial [Acidimicrobiia bacterium]